MRVTQALLVVSVFAAGCGGGGSHLPAPRLPDDAPEASASPAPAARPSAAADSAPPSRAGSQESPGAVAQSSAGSSVARASSPSQPTAGKEADARASATDSERRKVTVEQLAEIGRVFSRWRGQSRNYDTYPGPYTPAKPSQLSWRVSVLGADERYEELRGSLRPAETWDSPRNRAALRNVPDVFRSAKSPDGKTNLVLLTGAGTVYEQGKEANPANCPDGLENTIIALAIGDEYAVPWTSPEDFVFNPETAQQAFFGLYQDCCYALFGGSTGVRRIPADISDYNLLALITPAGGEQVDVQAVTRDPTPDADVELLTHLKEHPVLRFAVKSAPKDEGVAAAAQSDESAGQPATASASPVSTADPAAVVPPAGAQPVIADGVPDGRLPVPTEEAAQRVAGMYREVYGEQLLAVRTVEEKRALARKIFEQTGGLAADPVCMYVLLRAARDMAAQAGDLDTAFHAILEMAATFRAEALPMQVKAMEQVCAVSRDAASGLAVHYHAMRLADQALAKDDLTHAQRLLMLAQNLARRDHRRDDLARVSRKLDELQQVRTAQQRLAKHAQTLLQTPDDPVANAAVGKYLCLLKSDWDHGLPRLARGDNEILRRLAQREMRPPATAEQQLDVADGWWDWADTAGNRLDQLRARQRAVYWYRQTLPHMEAGLRRSRAEKRIRDVEEGGDLRKTSELADRGSAAG